MRSYASAYKMCGDVSPAPVSAGRPDRPVLAHALDDYRNQLYGRDPVLPQEAGVSSYIH
jgi:hypothetical protein